MRKCFTTWTLLLLAVTMRAETDFLKALPAADFTAAGLQKLSPEELARLEALVQQYKAGEVSEVRQQVDNRARASLEEAEKRIVTAEQKTKEAMAEAKAAVKAREAMEEAKAAAAATSPTPKSPPRWYSALLTLNLAGKKPEKEEPLDSRLTGDFTGWSGHTVFSLENGTRWVQQNKRESYAYSPVLHAPKVRITPAAITGFWLEIEGVNMGVRVVPLELVEQK